MSRAGHPSTQDSHQPMRSETLFGRHREQAVTAIHQSAGSRMQSQRRGFSAEFRDIEEAVRRQTEIVATVQLASLDLWDPEQYRQFKGAIENWDHSANNDITRASRKVQQALLDMLPAARQKQQLQRHCEEYRAYLQVEISDHLMNRYGVEHRQITGDNLDRFLARKEPVIPSSDVGAYRAIQKYQAVRVLQRTLETEKPATEQVRDFSQQLPKTRAIIDKSRDSAGVTFLKAISTVLSLGVAALAGIWSVKGEKTADRLTAVLTKPAETTASPAAR